jgi:alpha-L-rhamnosidase
MIDRGATTIWETWKESDDIYSNNHPMFGTITEWYYRWLAGIRPDPENPGFKEFILAPAIPKGLDYVNCSYQSPAGVITSNWRKDVDKSWRFEFSIPEGSVANVILPISENGKIEITKGNEQLKEQNEGLVNGKFRLGEGEYVITAYPVD